MFELHTIPDCKWCESAKFQMGELINNGIVTIIENSTLDSVPVLRYIGENNQVIDEIVGLKPSHTYIRFIKKYV